MVLTFKIPHKLCCSNNNGLQKIIQISSWGHKIREKRVAYFWNREEFYSMGVQYNSGIRLTQSLFKTFRIGIASEMLQFAQDCTSRPMVQKLPQNSSHLAGIFPFSN